MDSWDNPIYPISDPDGQDRGLIFLEENIDLLYLSNFAIMCYGWFPIRKALKLTFVCFQLQLFRTMQELKNWSWKQTNVSFQAFLLRNWP